MLEEEFKTKPADPLSNTRPVTVRMHITNLGYLEDRPLCFIKLPDGGIEEFNKMLVGLDTATIILESDNQDLPDLFELIDLEAKQVNKKKEKVERH